PINLTTKTIAGLRLGLGGDATSISVAPAGAIYVTAANTIYTFSPSLLTSGAPGDTKTCDQANQFQPDPPCKKVTPDAGFFGEPMQLHFDANGQFAYAANRTGGITGPSMFQVNLAANVITSWPPRGTNTPVPRFSELYVASSSRVFALAADTTTL